MLLAVAALGLGFCSCGGSDDKVASRDGESTTSTSQDPPASVHLDVQALPATGLMMYRADTQWNGVVLIDLDGKELLRLPGWQLNEPGSDPIWLWNDEWKAFYRFDPSGRRLVRGDRNMYPPKIDLAAPNASGGHWAARMSSPDGRRSLAQWRGECEVPTAYLAEGSHLIRDFGDNTVPLGWLDNTTAVISMLTAGCGEGDAPGTYRINVDRPGSRERITSYDYGAMWNTAPSAQHP